jgi:hypothetical protein
LLYSIATPFKAWWAVKKEKGFSPKKRHSAKAGRFLTLTTP